MTHVVPQSNEPTNVPSLSFTGESLPAETRGGPRCAAAPRLEKRPPIDVRVFVHLDFSVDSGEDGRNWEGLGLVGEGEDAMPTSGRPAKPARMAPAQLYRK